MKDAQYEIKLRALPWRNHAPPVKRLAQLLKVAARAFGFQCVSCKETEPTPEASK